MATKVILNAEAVRSLIALDEEGPVMEIARNAAAQVATLLNAELLKKPLEKRLGEKLDQLLMDGSYSGRINSASQQLLRAFLKTETEKFVKQITDGAIREAIRQHVAVVMAEERAKLDRTLRDQIDEMIRLRFAAAFGITPT